MVFVAVVDVGDVAVLLSSSGWSASVGDRVGGGLTWGPYDRSRARWPCGRTWTDGGVDDGGGRKEGAMPALNRWLPDLATNGPPGPRVGYIYLSSLSWKAVVAELVSVLHGSSWAWVQFLYVVNFIFSLIQ